jgi:hypothetical protein
MSNIEYLNGGKTLFQGQPKIVSKHSAQDENSMLEAER